MIAKASTISHGANAIRYSVNKEKADIVKANLLPDNISPEAMYGRMMLVQKKYAEKINKGRPLGRNVIRILFKKNMLRKSIRADRLAGT